LYVAIFLFSKYLIKFYAIEEKFWKQKAGMQWFEDGDGNTKFFMYMLMEKGRN